LRSDIVEPEFKVPDRPSKLDAFADRLAGWLKAQANKPRKQKRTLKQLHADLVALGYEGSYGRVAAFARAWKADRLRANSKPAGEARLSLWLFSRVRRSSSTGAKIWRSSAASGSSCKSHTSSSRTAARFFSAPISFKPIRRCLTLIGGDREMVEILALVLQHDEQAVLCAVELALSDGVPTKTHILNPAAQADRRQILGSADRGYATSVELGQRAARRCRAL
jgi:hypothetical protein